MEVKPRPDTRAGAQIVCKGTSSLAFAVPSFKGCEEASFVASAGHRAWSAKALVRSGEACLAHVRPATSVFTQPPAIGASGRRRRQGRP